MADIYPDVTDSTSPVPTATLVVEPPVRERIIVELVRRLNQITVTNEYSLEIGANVFRAWQSDDEDNLPTVSIWDGQERVLGGEYGDTILEMAVLVEVTLNPGENVTSASTAANLALSDVIRAVLAGTFALVRKIEYRSGVPIYPEVGRRVVGVRVEFAVEYAILAGNPLSSN